MLFNYAVARQTKFVHPKKDLDIIQMNKFLGTWEWKSKTSSFTMILKKWQVTDDFCIIRGWYRYIKGEKIIFDRLDSVDRPKSSVVGGTVTKGNDSLKMGFEDITQKYRNGTLNFVNGNSNKILFKLKGEQNDQSVSRCGNSRKLIFNDKLPYDLNMIMTRIK